MKLRTAFAAAALAMISVPAWAQNNVNFTSLVPQWFAPVPVAGVAIDIPPPVAGTTTAFWGTPFPNPITPLNQSGYVFDAVTSLTLTTPLGGGDSGIGILGDFTHENWPITPPTLSSISLRVTTDIDIDGDPQGSFAFVFDFTHEETPNGGVPGGPFAGNCPYGTPITNGVGVNINGCADRVTFTPVNDQQVFQVGVTTYTLTILGFSTDNCATIQNEFLTTEQNTNTAQLCAQVTATNRGVPEPGSLALVGLALLAAGFIRRKTIG